MSLRTWLNESPGATAMEAEEKAQKARAQKQTVNNSNSVPGTPVAVVPFDQRTDISADAYHIARCAREDSREAAGRIVKNLWIIFVLLPVALGIVFAILKLGGAF